jgi:serine/threonine-protein kinase ATR
MLAELEQSWTVLNNTPANQPISDAHRQHLLHDWESRFKLTQPSLKTREPVLNLRFSLLTMLGVPSEANRTCLKLARVARSAQRYPTARYALLKIQDFSTRGYTMENARVLWETGQGPRALNDLRRVIGTHQSLASGTLITLSGETSTSLLSAEREAEDSAKKSDQDRSLAKAALQVAMWLDSTGQLSPQEIINYYRVAIQSVKAWSKAYFHFGRYLDKTSQQLLQAALGQQSTFPSSFSSPSPAESKAGNSKKSGADEEKPVKWDLLPDVLGNYSLCLVFGHQYVHQVMPRMLTLWLDAGETFQRIEKPAHVLHTRSSSLNGPSQYEIATDGWKKTDQVIASSLEKLAPYFWFTALPQLLSRIAHPQAEVWKRMKGIILDKLLLLWPHQTVWYTIALAISGNRTSTRFMRYKEIREEVKRRSRLPGKDNAATSHQAAAALSLIDESEKLGSLLLEVAKYTLPNTQNPSYTLSIKKLFAKLGSRYDETAPPERARMIIPSETQLSATVPFIEEWDPDTVRKLRQHTPFSPKGQLVFINGFEDKVEVMRSLIKPKRLTMVGTDGRGYGFLAKPKDDLRKDARLMEFNTVVNKLLRHDPEGRRRQLYIRTYPVILLSEDSGMLGWVKGTRPYRSIVSELYESEGNPYINLFTETKALYTSLNKNDPTWLPKWREMRDRVWYSIFWKFFVNNFPEPSAWYRARLAYTRTCAVMSFVGFVLGLGDRHGENILFDQVTGDTVHVDLNCLFFRGQMLAEPERVPFRLTHNMVDAMGVTGCEGVFRRTSEIVVRTLLANKETLLSVLETLVHDPLIEWSKQQPNAAPGELDFITQETMRGIAERLSCIKVCLRNITKESLVALFLISPSTLSSCEHGFSIYYHYLADMNVRYLYLAAYA